MPGRMTLKAGTPEHRAFGASMALALGKLKREKYDEGFVQTLQTHQKLFKHGEDYPLLVDDFRYIMDLATLELRGAADRH